MRLRKEKVGEKSGKPAFSEEGRLRFTVWEFGLFAVCLVFYLLFPLIDGPVWCKDSPSYASMGITREPLYPTFLWIMRTIFGEEGYLFPVVIAQSVLASYATWKLGVTVGRMKGSRLLSSLSVFFQFAVTLLCRFVAIRGSSYIDSIMTEGLGLSLYVLFSVQLYLYVSRRKAQNLAGTAVYALLLVSLRKQMMITLLLMAGMFALYDLIKKRKLMRLFCLLALTAGVLLVSKGADRLYNYAVRGVWIEHSGNSMGALCTLVYTSQEKDEELFTDETARGLFREIRSRADEQGLLYDYADKGWVELSTHYADSYDAIGYGIVNPVVQGYEEEHGVTAEVEKALWYDELCGSMVRTLLGQDKGRLLQVYFSNTVKGFVNSVARVNPVLNLYAAAAYLLYLALYVYLAVRGRGWKAEGGTLTFAETVLGGIAVNSLVVGAMIFCQPRYMIYGMGLFYSALSLLLYDACAQWKRMNPIRRNQ